MVALTKVRWSGYQTASPEKERNPLSRTPTSIHVSDRYPLSNSLQLRLSRHIHSFGRTAVHPSINQTSRTSKRETPIKHRHFQYNHLKPNTTAAFGNNIYIYIYSNIYKKNPPTSTPSPSARIQPYCTNAPSNLCHPRHIPVRIYRSPSSLFLEISPSRPQSPQYHQYHQPSTLSLKKSLPCLGVPLKPTYRTKVGVDDNCSRALASEAVNRSTGFLFGKFECQRQ